MIRPLQVAVAATLGPHTSHEREGQHLQTSSVGFALWWTVLLLLHALNAGYYGGAGVLYRVMRLTSVDFQLRTYSIGISSQQYLKVSTIHWIVAAVHVLLILAMILGSLQARQLAFRFSLPRWVAPACAKVLSIVPVPQLRIQDHSSLGRDLSRHFSSLSEYSIVVSSSVFGRKGLLGVEGVYFDHLHLARELLETTLQTIQVYRMSYLLPRVWLIRFYVVLLITNCWSTPIVHRYYGNRHVERRMMSLLCDAVLDMVSSIGVSFWIFATYLPQYTDPIDGFPFYCWLDDVWFTNVLQEFQIMMVVSWVDMASRLVFAVGLLQCTEAIKDMLTPPVETKTPPTKSNKVAVATIVKPDQEKQEAAREPHKSTGPANAHLTEMKKASTLRSSRLVKFLLEKAGPQFFIVLGFAILVVHLVSETREPSAQIPCRLKLHPWFVNKPACALVELDCHQLGGLSGSHKSMQEAWQAFEFGATARIFVRHCPQLEVPSTIQQFQQITSVKLYNCTITAWPIEAAFTNAAHERLRALIAVRTNFSNGALPPGLLTPQFPKGLRCFVTSATNLQFFPDNLHELWPPVMTLVFERGPLQAVPPIVMKMNPSVVSFAGSPIATIPAAFFEIPKLGIVFLSYTKLQVSQKRGYRAE